MIRFVARRWLLLLLCLARLLIAMRHSPAQGCAPVAVGRRDAARSMIAYARRAILLPAGLRVVLGSIL